MPPKSQRKNPKRTAKRKISQFEEQESGDDTEDAPTTQQKRNRRAPHDAEEKQSEPSVDNSMPPPPGSRGSTGTIGSSQSFSGKIPSSYQTSYLDPTESTKRKLFLRDGKQCWACETETSIDIAHLLPRDELWFKLYQEKGLINFSHPAHHENLLPLCKNCHDQFDANIPGWIFIPSDLAFLIEYEEQDYRYRVQLAAAGQTVPKRSVPPAQGILYSRYIVFRHFRSQITQEKSWSGSPTAAILKAAHGVANPVACLPSGVRQEFTVLVEIYNRPDPQPTVQSQPTLGVTAVSAKEPEPKHHEHKSPPSNQKTSSGGATRKEPPSMHPHISGSDHGQQRGFDGEAEFLAWGPSSSSRDKIEWVSHFRTAPIS